VKKNTLTWMAAIGGACLLTAVVSPRLARSADHRDGPAVKADPSTDINDVYSFMDGNNAVFVMTVFPVADANSKFSDAAAYVLHTESAAAFGATSNPLDIICSFDAAQKIQCWAGDEYATGDAAAASSAAGVASTSGKMKVFAGRRADPFFFNLEGFNDTRKFVVDNAAGLQDAGVFNAKGCPQLDTDTSNAVIAKLQGTDGGAAQDFFKPLNTLAIVVSIDKTLVTKGGKLVTVWASTNKKS
jgi:hypothetical protein